MSERWGLHRCVPTERAGAPLWQLSFGDVPDERGWTRSYARQEQDRVQTWLGRRARTHERATSRPASTTISAAPVRRASALLPGSRTSRTRHKRTLRCTPALGSRATCAVSASCRRPCVPAARPWVGGKRASINVGSSYVDSRLCPRWPQTPRAVGVSPATAKRNHSERDSNPQSFA